MRIVKFRFNGSDVRDDGGYGHFEYDVIRSADDHARGTPFRATGKGAVNCSIPRTAIAVWSMSAPSSGRKKQRGPVLRGLAKKKWAASYSPGGLLPEYHRR